MERIKTDLWNILQELTADQFISFKWFLNERGIPKARLEDATRHDTVDLLVQTYPGPAALDQTSQVLALISRNDLVQHLHESSSGPRVVNGDAAAPLRGDFERIKADVGSKLELMIQERTAKLGEIRRSAEISSKSADRHVADSRRAFGVLLQAVRTSLSDVTAAIDAERRATQAQAAAFTAELQREISELENAREQTEKLSYSEEHVRRLGSFTPSVKDWTRVGVRPPAYGGAVGSAVNRLVADVTAEKDKLIGKAKLNRVQEFAEDVTLDPDTANAFLVVSDDGRRVHYGGGSPRDVPDTPGRFDTAINVLGAPGVSKGRFYFQVQVEGKSSWDVGVVRESARRKGSITATEEGGYWTVFLRHGAQLRSSAGALRPPPPPPGRVGVYVDYDKRSVLFFDVDSADVIHTFTDCRFSEKLRPFFSPGKSAGPLVITPVSFTDHVTTETVNNDPNKHDKNVPENNETRV